MGILSDNLQSVTVSAIIKAEKLHKVDTQHIVTQKLGNNPIEKYADDNIYTKCSFPNIDSLIICGYGEKNERGLGALRDIDYASYITKIAVAIKEIPVVRTNGPFSNASSELMNFLHIWKKYYGSRTSHYRISSHDKPANPFTIVSAGITKNDRNMNIEMCIANIKLIENSYGEQKYYGDLILFAKENLGYGAAYNNLSHYSENPQDRTTLSAITGKHEYGQKLYNAVKESFENMSFIIKDSQTIRPDLSIVKHMLWVSNNYKQKTMM